MKRMITTYGAELEKAVAKSTTGLSYKVSQSFFQILANDAKKRKTFHHFHKSDIKPNIILGTNSTDLGEQGVDNGFNLLETALPYQKSLTTLHKKMLQDLQTTLAALEKENATAINLSIHPLATRDMATYKKMVAPKGIYDYIWYRGWDHSAGIDARAQNSPTTSVTLKDAADAVSVIIGAGAAFVGLFANSPFEEGKRSTYKEARLTMWERMMAKAKVKGDRDTSVFPKKRFHCLADYFTWMFGGNTGIHFVLTDTTHKSNDYKGIGKQIAIVKGNPSVLEYLSKPSWEARLLVDELKNNKSYFTITPHISHMEVLQFTQFAGARIRYGIKDADTFPLQTFAKACRNHDTKTVEKIFTKHAAFCYIEGRDPGANFPDAELMKEGKQIALTTMIAPSVMQAGLLRNLKEATAYIDSLSWNDLGKLRDAAIKEGLNGKVGKLTVYDFTHEILRIACKKLTPTEKKLLAYTDYVMQTKMNAADRAIAFIEDYKGTKGQALQALVKARKVIIT